MRFCFVVGSGFSRDAFLQLEPKASNPKALPAKSLRWVARASLTVLASLLRCRSGLSRDAFSRILPKSIEPEGSSYEELALGGAGFDGEPRVAASLLEAASAAMPFSASCRRASSLKALPTESVRNGARISMNAAALRRAARR
jgi:hypothetical protein